MRGNEAMAQMLGGAERAAARIAGAVVDRLEVARGQAIEAGAPGTSTRSFSRSVVLGAETYGVLQTKVPYVTPHEADNESGAA
ncbi:hypothetical protein GTG23_00165 [Rhodococcus hoagii]|nr:hypothetical protein [Prescottella equi]